MSELIALFVVILVSLIVVRVGTIALAKTGLSRDVAGFQAQSAFMGVGFTTTEAETVVQHPVRRKIVRLLMLVGFVAVTSALGTLVLTFTRDSPGGVSLGYKLLALGLGLALVLTGLRLGPVDRLMNRVISQALEGMGSLHPLDYEELLHLDKGYTVAVVPVTEGSWIASGTLRQLALAREGLLVLNVERANGHVIGTPSPDTQLMHGDRSLIYGHEDDLRTLRQRLADWRGDAEHRKAMSRLEERRADEAAEDEEGP